MDNREIKFRAWDKTSNQIIVNYAYTGSYGELYTVQFHDSAYSNKGVPDLILMQYTGLKDKNGVEIYEGDVLKIETENYKIINVVCERGIARRKMVSGLDVDIPSFYFKRKDGLKSFPIVNNWQGKHDLEIIEVIGNIHENPELK